MAVLNRVPLSEIIPLSEFEVFYNESVSLTSVAGEGTSSSRTVPADKYWILQALRAYNGEAATRQIEFLITDGDGTTHGQLTLTGTRYSVPTLEECGWSGRVILPPGWRIYAKWHAMTGGSTVNWQFQVIERSLSFKGSVFS